MWATLIGYGAAALAVAVALWFRERAKRYKEKAERALEELEEANETLKVVADKVANREHLNDPDAVKRVLDAAMRAKGTLPDNASGSADTGGSANGGDGGGDSQ